jgi:outer membrane lipopolysaccharide assembly protein LptE/RlpB
MQRTETRKEKIEKSGLPFRSAFASLAILFSICYFLFSLAGCGYHVAGRGTRLPREIRTIAVPAFENKTTTHRIEQRLTEAVVHEFLARTKYRIVADEADADAALRGQVTSVETGAILFDANTGRATTMLVTVRMSVQLTERPSGNVLYENTDFLFRDEYEISTDVTSFFEEQGPAFNRLSRDFAATLVSAILENF